MQVFKGHYRVSGEDGFSAFVASEQEAETIPWMVSFRLGDWVVYGEPTSDSLYPNSSIKGLDRMEESIFLHRFQVGKNRFYLSTDRLIKPSELRGMIPAKIFSIECNLSVAALEELKELGYVQYI